MKKAKLTAILLSIFIMLMSLTPAAFAVEGFDSLGGILGIPEMDPNKVDQALDNFGGNGGLNFSDLFGGGLLSKIKDALGGDADGKSTSDILGAITSLFGGGSLSKDLLSPDVLDQIAKLLAAENITTTEEETTAPPPSTTEPTTVFTPPTTEPTTVYTPPATSYQGAQNYPTSGYVAPPATDPTSAYSEPSSYQYVPVMNTTVPFLEPTDNYLVEDDFGEDAGVSGKMIVGIIILVMSAAAVVVVAVLLKKSRM